eukprot:TRINITY_DN57130_c0_g1_i1.p1 TRINITY_DN57130_c0_g1~~TRINITY_DN57130_c0_g1_i1.p1  ORF type:complete len:328 (+),score=65.64 TRINITY_DN57130_c0_g1_i1:54-1037(+)
MKCGPVIRCCGYAKVPVGLVFILVGVWLLANPFNYECGKMAEMCAGPVEDMLKMIHIKDKDYDVASDQSTIESYCNCLSTCPNYFVVYEQTKTEQVPTNCFQFMPTFGIAEPPGNTRRLRARRLGNGGQDLPGFAKDECQDCETLEGHAKTLQVWLAVTQLLIGSLILATAGCEHLEMKWQSKLFSLCVIFADFAGAAGCFVGIIVSGYVLWAARSSCNADAMESNVIDAGNDSASDPDNAAMIKHFLEKMLEPMLSKICASKTEVLIYHMASWFGVITLLSTAVSSACVCLGCSDDGKTGVQTPDDMRALALQQLHNTDDDDQDQW